MEKKKQKNNAQEIHIHFLPLLLFGGSYFSFQILLESTRGNKADQQHGQKKTGKK